MAEEVFLSSTHICILQTLVCILRKSMRGFSRIDLPGLSSNQAETLDAPITEDEVRNAVKLMKSGKGSGVRWPPCWVLYKNYIDILTPILTKGIFWGYTNRWVTLYIQSGSNVIDTQTRERNLSNNRPIGLASVDYKILTNVLAIYLKTYPAGY